MKTQIMIVFLAITLAACARAQTNTADIQNTAVAIVQTGVALTQTALPTAAPTNTPTALPTSTPAATATPTQPVVSIITPNAIQVERWKEYQTELAKSVLPYDPSPIVLCEWAILGQSNQEVYLWAVCEGVTRDGAPVVVYLNTDGTIQNAKAVGYGSMRKTQIQQLFPPDIQEKIYSKSMQIIYERLVEHLDWRFSHREELPLIVLSATPVP
jgi:hypothetical protein